VSPFRNVLTFSGSLLCALRIHTTRNTKPRSHHFTSLNQHISKAIWRMVALTDNGLSNIGTAEWNPARRTVLFCVDRDVLIEIVLKG